MIKENNDTCRIKRNLFSVNSPEKQGFYLGKELSKYYLQKDYDKVRDVICLCTTINQELDIKVHLSVLAIIALHETKWFCEIENYYNVIIENMKRNMFNQRDVNLIERQLKDYLLNKTI